MGPAKAAELLYFGRKVIIDIYFTFQKNFHFLNQWFSLVPKIGVVCVLLKR